MVFRRPRQLRPLAVAYLWGVALAAVFTGTSAIHPSFGRAWDVVATTGALAIAALPFVVDSRWRAALTAAGAFVILAHAVEWLRLTRASLTGLSIAALWLTALFGIVLQVSSDQEVRLSAKLDRDDPPAS